MQKNKWKIKIKHTNKTTKNEAKKRFTVYRTPNQNLTLSSM